MQTYISFRSHDVGTKCHKARHNLHWHSGSSQMSSSTRPIVFMDVNIGETPAGRLKMELFSDIVPKSVVQALLYNLKHFLKLN